MNTGGDDGPPHADAFLTDAPNDASGLLRNRRRASELPGGDHPREEEEEAVVQPASVASSAASAAAAASEDDAATGAASSFECGICLDSAKEPVVTLCGHLFCWPCVYTWMDMHPECPSCPTCKAQLSKETLVPIYVRGGDNRDPRENVPQRPRAARPNTVPVSNPANQNDMFHFFNQNFRAGHGGGINFGFPLMPLMGGLMMGAGQLPRRNDGQAQDPEVRPLESASVFKSMIVLALVIFLMTVMLQGQL